MAGEKSPSSRDRELLKPVATTIDHDGGASSSKPSPASSSPSHNSGREGFRLGIYDDWINILSCCLIDLNAFIANYLIYLNNNNIYHYNYKPIN
ncbi:hypothetical protein Hanom_Chr01g00028061 [Helianthus anomalus]